MPALPSEKFTDVGHFAWTFRFPPFVARTCPDEASLKSIESKSPSRPRPFPLTPPPIPARPIIAAPTLISTATS